MSIDIKIRELRKKKGLTQKELAEKVNVSAQVVSNWERKYTHPDHEDVLRLAKALDCSSDYLLGRTDDPTPPEQELDEWGLSEEAQVFFKDFESLSEEDKKEVMKYIKYLKYQAELHNKENDN